MLARTEANPIFASGCCNSLQQLVFANISGEVAFGEAVTRLAFLYFSVGCPSTE